VVGLRRASHAERAHQAVGLEAARAEHFREPPGADAAVHFELPQAVLGMDEAQGELGVTLRGGEDVRHPIAIAQDLDRRADSGDRDLPFELG
jgi:hypothetical protein